MAQAPVAVPVGQDSALVYDPANDFFDRCKNLYDSAEACKDVVQRQELFLNAANKLGSYLAEYPNHENAQKAWWYLGNSHFQAGQMNEGKHCFSTLLNRYPKGPWVAAAAYTMAAEHYNRGQYALAAPLFERYALNVEKEGEKLRGTYFAGNCYRLLGQDHQALQAFQKVVGQKADLTFVPQAELAIGHLTVKLGKTQDAYDRFVAISEKDYLPAVRGEALLHAGLTARKLGKKGVAGPYFDAILRQPEMGDFWADAQAGLMANAFELGEYKKVLELFEANKVKTEGEQEASRLMIAARSHMRLKQHEKALALFRQVERLVEPESEFAFKASYYRLLCFFEIEGHHVPDQVDAFLQLYRKSYPRDFRIHTALIMKAESLHSKGRVAEAAQIYNEVEATCVSEQNRPGLHYQKGWCLAEAGDHIGAIRSLSQFISDYPKDTRVTSALAKRAKVYVDSGKSPKAIADYDRLVELGKPEELVSLAWLESARLRRAENNLEDMMIRYQGLLRDVKKLSDGHQAEANYWVGWGLVKTNRARDSIEYLEKARALRSELYQKHAGILLALGYFAAQDADKLALEIKLAIEKGYQKELPNQALQWSGMQSYNVRNFAQAAMFLGLVANREEPRETPKEVWRYLAKSQLELGKAEAALESVQRVLEVEDNLAWKADGLLDRSTALFALSKFAETRQSVDEALALQPQGRTRGSLRILMGDLEMKAGDPKKASAQYLIVVSFIEDDLLKPLALSKLIAAFEAQPDAVQAEKYRQQLKNEFPGWKAP